MPTTKPRVNVVLEQPLFEALGRVAEHQGSSLSTTARDLLRDALETYEDVGLARIAEERDRTFDDARAQGHDQVWGVRRAKKR